MPASTIASPSTFVSDPIKGSRFVARVAPCADAEAALAQLDEARSYWPDASHHCWAYRLASGETRSSDDGEPGGSAGRPILAQIEGHEVVDAIVVVARWFGGTKLGVGGLVRAYGGCAGQALDRAHGVPFVPMAEDSVTFAHPDTGDVHHVLATHGVTVLQTDYATGVTLRIRFAEADRATLAAALRDRTAGRVTLSESPGV